MASSLDPFIYDAGGYLARPRPQLEDDASATNLSKRNNGKRTSNYKNERLRVRE
jgi:hypothetical protein